MAGSYGAEALADGGRYRLSFTVGGLLVPQGRILASMFVRAGFLEDPGEDAAAAATGAADGDGEVGERITLIRRDALDANVLSIRTQAANSRVVTEVCKRLSALTGPELRHLAGDGTPFADRQALMWVAMCRYYALVGEFAREVVRDHYLLGVPTVTHEDYDRFILGKAMWHAELEGLSPSTAAKLRSNVFRAMTEAGLLDDAGNGNAGGVGGVGGGGGGGGGDTLLPSLLGATLAGILDARPESFLFFPVRRR